MGLEGGHFEWHDRRGIEARVEGLPQLRAFLDRLLVPGAGVNELEKLLRQEPQRDSRGKLRYLLTSGLAVEIITGFEREHHDIDLVIMDPKNVGYWEIYGTDNVTPGLYWAEMSFDPEYLDKTARMAKTRITSGLPIETVHPGILMVQKSSDAFGRPPRQKDIDDVNALISYWKKEPNPELWYPVAEQALKALPPNQFEKTLERLDKLINKK